MNVKQMRLNLLFTSISFILSLGLNFYITPVLSEHLGDAAYGFVGMSNDFVSYASTIAAVLNSVAARFITIEMYQKNYKKANKYYVSLLVANSILAVVLAIIGASFVAKMESILVIPESLNSSVKITFILTFLNYIIILITTVFSICTYVTNRLDIAGFRNSISYIIRFLIIVVLFHCVGVKMYYIAFATIISTIFLAITNIKLTKKLVPEFSFDIKNFDVGCVRVLALSGIWMAISNLSQILMTGLDSVITNKMLGADAMGILGIARTIPNAIILAISTLGVIFTPNFVKLYAEGKREELILACNKSIQVMAMVLGVPIVGVMIFGSHFYSLWLPYKTINEIEMIQILSVLMMMQSVFNMLTISIAQLSVVTNKLKTPVFVSLFLGFINIIIVVILIKYTNLGLYAVAGVSSILFIVRYLIFNPVYAAYVLKTKWYTFYGTIGKNILCLLLLTVIYKLISKYVILMNWQIFIPTMAFIGVVGYIIVILLNKILGKKRCFSRKDSENVGEN